MKLFLTSLWTLITVLLPLHTLVRVQALATGIVIEQVQLSGALSGTASQELVVVRNNSTESVEIAGWCVYYAPATYSSVRKMGCVEEASSTSLWLQAGTNASFASTDFLFANPAFIADFPFSDGMAANGGHVWIENASHAVVDLVGWGTAVAAESLQPVVAPLAGQLLTRNTDTATGMLIDTDSNVSDFTAQSEYVEVISGVYEETIEIDICPNINEVQTMLPDGYGINEEGDCYVDTCHNIDGLQIELPEEYEIGAVAGECVEILFENAQLLLTELLPNVPGNDAGNEFIEIYNPNDRPVALNGYLIELGPTFTKQVELQNDVVLQPESYYAIRDSESGIVLPNTTGIALRLKSPAGTTVFESPAYSDASDTVSWAVVEDQWIYTNQITPGSANKPYLEPALSEVAGVTTVLAPCPVGKYRNPETNRCRSFETAVSVLVPCDEDEYRSTETNRCRKIAPASSSSALVPCDPGEERNPETNRCRKIVSATIASDFPEVVDIPSSGANSAINWPIAGSTIFGTVGYMAYEWRIELRKQWWSRTIARIK